MQTTASTHSQNRTGDTRSVVVVTAKDWRPERQIETRYCDVIVHHDARRMSNNLRYVHSRQRGLSATSRNSTEVFLDELTSFGRVEVARDGEHCIIRSVIRLEELPDVVERRRGKILHRADQRVMKWVRLRKRERRESLQPCSIRLIVDGPAALILHDVALCIQLFLRHRRQQAAHSVCFQPESERQLIRGNCLVIVRPLQPCRSVESPAGSLYELEVLVGTDVLRSLKKHMLEQMGKARAPNPFVCRADMVPQVDRDNRRSPIL